MALIHCKFISDVLGLSTSMNVILPQTPYNEIKQGSISKKKYPTLFLLHGLSGDNTCWLRRTSIERHVCTYNLAVVMPEVGRSFYTDMATGLKYWTFISEELPALARSFFPLSEAREDNFVAGMSMGGYGAFKMALRCPDKFAAAASLSGSVDVDARNPEVFNIKSSSFYKGEYRNIFGEQRVRGTDNDLFHLAKKVATSDGPKPSLFQCCGTEDFLYEDNIRFKQFCESLPLDYVYEEEPGVHNFGYWDMKIQRVLEWLPIKPV